MKRVYIAHPLRGEKPYTEKKIKEHLSSATLICSYLFHSGAVLPFSPLHAFGFLDPITVDQEKVMSACLSLLDQCDEIWLFDNWSTSEGCRIEILHAIKHKIPIRFISFDEDSPEESYIEAVFTPYACEPLDTYIRNQKADEDENL